MPHAQKHTPSTVSVASHAPLDSALQLPRSAKSNCSHMKSPFMLVTRETSQVLIFPYFSSAVELFWIQSPTAVAIEVELNSLPPV